MTARAAGLIGANSARRHDDNGRSLSRLKPIVDIAETTYTNIPMGNMSNYWPANSTMHFTITNHARRSQSVEYQTNGCQE